MEPIIDIEQLLALDQSKYILFDVSAGSKPRYDQTHLDGAFYIDLNTDLAEIGDFAKGGRHPLPAPEHFVRVLESFGVTNDSHLILYDDKNGANAAARLWWMLRSIGHEKVQVLNGGFKAAIEANFPVSSEVLATEPSQYVLNGTWHLPTVTIDEVEQAQGHAENVIIDVRDADRYAGLTEPIDLVAGHIPGAINIPFTENLDKEGLFLPVDILKDKYLSILGDAKTEDIIVHCGSGVTACHTLLALDYAGLGIPQLYVGSWSEWSRSDKPF